MCALLGCSTFAQAQSHFSDFDKANGANTYTGLSDNNWVNPAIVGLTANAGTEVFASANGNASGVFDNLGIEKTLGGIIEDKTYDVSFYITTYGAGSGIAYTDFSELYIGNSGGIMSWTETPTPTVSTQWVKWSGTFKPNQSDIGKPFVFKAIFGLNAQTAVAIDGLIDIAEVTTLGIASDININDEVSVYPNPFNDKLTIDLTKNANYAKIEIFNAAGEMIQVIDRSVLNSNTDAPLNVGIAISFLADAHLGN